MPKTRPIPRPPKAPAPPKTPPLPKGWDILDQATWGEVYGSSLDDQSGVHWIATDPEWNIRLVMVDPASDEGPALSGYDPIFLAKALESPEGKAYSAYLERARRLV